MNDPQLDLIARLIALVPGPYTAMAQADQIMSVRFPFFGPLLGLLTAEGEAISRVPGLFYVVGGPWLLADVAVVMTYVVAGWFIAACLIVVPFILIAHLCVFAGLFFPAIPWVVGAITGAL